MGHVRLQLTLVCLLASAMIAHAQPGWVIQSSPVNDPLGKVQFVSTTDGRNTWSTGKSANRRVPFSPFGSSSTPATSQDTVITSQFFGFDFFIYELQHWRDVMNLMNEDTVSFGMVGAGMGWEKIEPNPPQQGVHSYDWSGMDRMMRLVVESGRVLDFNIVCRSNWATVVPYRNMDEECCDMSPPKEDSSSDVASWGMTAYQAWSDFVFNFVERYDGDGVNDAPGVTRAAMRYFELGDEPEWPGHFVAYGGTPELYDRMLAVTYQAAKRADPNIVVVRGKSNAGNTFDDDPDEATLKARLGSLLDFVSTSLRLGRDHFDIFAINFNDHYSGLFPRVRWLQAEMAKNGYSKPFLVSDARTALYPRDNDSSTHILPPRYPLTFIETLRTPSDPQHAANRRLYHADEVRQSLRKMLVSLASGQRAISLQPAMGVRVVSPTALWQDAELLDMRVYQATGDLHKARKPVYYASKQLMDALLGADREVKSLDMGTNVFAYQVTNRGKNFFFLWHENPFDVDAQGLVRRGQQKTLDLTPFVSSSQVHVKHFVTGLDTNYAPIYPPEKMTSARQVTIDETPVLVEAFTLTSVEDERENVPQEFRLYQNYPNPFNPTTTIRFSLSRRAHVTLKVFDVLGREVATLVDEKLDPGEHSVVYDAKSLTSGIYFYRLQAGGFVQQRKMIVVK